MKRYITGIFAVIIAISAVAFTIPNHKVIKHNPDMLSYYFKFVGAHGDESVKSEWQEISLSAYNSLLCNASSEGCKIATNSVSNPAQSFPNRQISSVPVDANDVPQVSMANYDVANQP